MASRCIVLVPYLTHIEPGCERGLRDLERRGLEVRRYPATAAVDRTRSEVATAALAEGYDELMWIDADISFEADDVQRLRAHDLPLVAGVYAKKGQPGLAVYLEPGTRELRVGEGAGVTAVRYVGAGFLLTRRGVYEAIQRTFSLPTCNTRFGAPVVPYFLPMVIADPETTGGFWYLGEDYALCERARVAGFGLSVDPAIRIGHIGTYIYGWEDAAQRVPRVASAVFTVPTSTRPEP